MPRLRSMSTGKIIAAVNVAIRLGVLISIAGAIVGAAEPLDPLAQELVRQLDHPDHRSRIKAEAELRELGDRALPSLEEALSINSGELRYRAQRVIAAIKQQQKTQTYSRLVSNPWRAEGEFGAAWEKLHRLAGDSPATRALFISMLRHDPELTLSVAGEQRVTRLLLEQRCTNFQSLQQFSMNSATLSLGQTAAILFAALCVDQPGSRSPSTVNTLLNSATFQKALEAEQKALALQQQDPSLGITTPPLQSLLAQWIVRPGLVSPHSRLAFAARHAVPEGVVPARELLAAGQGQMTQPQAAIFFLAMHGGPEVVPELEALLTNAFPLRSTTHHRASEQIRITCQVRDVALLALVLRLEQDPVEFGFSGLSPGLRAQMDLDKVGFLDDGQREAAIKKWRDWSARSLPLLLKPWPDASEGVPL